MATKQDRLIVRIQQQEIEIQDLKDELARLRGRFTNLDLPRYSGDPMLDDVLATRSPSFDENVAMLPATYWARYDLSAVRVGWEMAHRSAEKPARPGEPWY